MQLYWRITSWFVLTTCTVQGSAHKRQIAQYAPWYVSQQQQQPSASVWQTTAYTLPNSSMFWQTNTFPPSNFGQVAGVLSQPSSFLPASSKTYQIEIQSYNPDQLPTIMQRMPEMLASMTPKLGGRLIGKYMASLGTAFEILLLFEYDSLQNRLDTLARYTNDPFMLDFGRFEGQVMRTVEYWFLKPVPLTTPALPATGNILLQRFEFNGVNTEALNEFVRSISAASQRMGVQASAAKIAAAFVPILGKTTNRCFILWDVPRQVSIDEHIDSIKKIVDQYSVRYEQSSVGTRLVDIYSVLWQPMP